MSLSWVDDVFQQDEQQNGSRYVDGGRGWFKLMECEYHKWSLRATAKDHEQLTKKWKEKLSSCTWQISKELHGFVFERMEHEDIILLMQEHDPKRAPRQTNGCMTRVRQ